MRKIIDLILTVILASGAFPFNSMGETRLKPPPKYPLGSPDFYPTADHPYGWRGNGSGSFPGATPPSTWSRQKAGNGYEAKNILWTTKLPAHSPACPIIAGKKIVVQSEISDLVCLDKENGKILWIRPNTVYEAIRQEFKDELARLTLRFAGVRGKELFIVSSLPVDEGTAIKTAAYDTQGAKLDRVEISCGGRVIRLVATEPWPLGAELMVKFTGLKSKSGMTPADPLIFKLLPGRPVSAGLVEEFLVGEPRDKVDAAKILSEDLLDAKTIEPAIGDKWRPVSAADGIIDLNAALGARENAVGHAHLYVYSDSDRTVEFRCGSDDGIKISVNGATVHNNPAMRGITEDQDKIPGVQIKKGWNRVLIAVSQGSGGWNFCLRIVDSEGKVPSGLSYMAENPEKAEAKPLEVLPGSGFGSTPLERIEPLYERMIAANLEVIQAVNAKISAAGPNDEDRSALDVVVGRKRDIEKQIYGLMTIMDRKRFGLDWQQGVFGFSSATPVTDGKFVYAWFGTGVVACYDLDGNRQWIRFDNFGNLEHGTYASPMVIGEKLITWMKGTTAYDKRTGKQIWHTPSKIGADWGSLFAVYVGAEAMVSCAEGMFCRVTDGKAVLGGSAQFGTHITPSPIVPDGNIHAFAGKFSKFNAPHSVTNKLTKSWSMDFKWPPELGARHKDFAGGFVSSPLYHDGLIYLVAEGGALAVVDAKTGEQVYSQLLEMDPRIAYWTLAGVAASPALAGKYIYMADNSGNWIVCEPGRKFKQIARNVMENILDGQQEVSTSTPVFEGNRIYFRGPEYLYCIGEK